MWIFYSVGPSGIPGIVGLSNTLNCTTANITKGIPDLLSYIWRLNGESLEYSASTLQLNEILLHGVNTATGIGQYECRVTNGYGTSDWSEMYLVENPVSQSRYFDVFDSSYVVR